MDVNDDFLWNPIACTENAFAVCETDPDECLTSPCDSNANCINTIGSFTCQCQSAFYGDGFTCQPICSPGYTMHGGYCYMLSPVPGRAIDALNYCTSQGGRAAEPKSQEEHDNIKAMLTGSTWIGVTDVDADGTFTYASDDSAPVFTSWAAAPGSGNCVMMDSAQDYNWVEASCLDTSPVVCQQVCNPGYSLYGAYCYKTSPGPGNALQVLTYCIDQGGILAEPRSQEEHDHIKSILSETTWIGMADLNNDGWYTYISDDTPVRFTSLVSPWWGNGQCVVMESTESYNWLLTDCTNTHPAVCQQDHDECHELLPPPCDVNANCTNTYGSFTCQCRPGFPGDGFNCDAFTIVHLAFRLTNVDYANVTATQSSIDTFKLNFASELRQLFLDESFPADRIQNLTVIDLRLREGSVTPVVEVDIHRDEEANLVTLVDSMEGTTVGSHYVDQTATGQKALFVLVQCDGIVVHDCHVDATCISTWDDGYYCSCKSGFTGDGTSCEDINECALGSYDCPSGTRCRNTAGSYECVPGCPSGYYTGGEGTQCYKVHDEARSATMAAFVCESDGATLVMPKSQTEHDYLVALSTALGFGQFWIGITDNGLFGATEGTYIYMNGDPLETFEKWSAGNTNTGADDCVYYMANGGDMEWNTGHCLDDNKYYICELPINTCRNNPWHGYKGLYYKVFSTVSVTYDEAKELCQNLDAALAMPVDVGIQESLQLTITDDTWIALDDRTTEGSFVWGTGSTLDSTGYTNWKSDVSTINDDANDCVMIEPSASYRWSPTSCDNRKSFVCQSAYPTKWIRQEGHSICYYFEDQDATFSDAIEKCACSGGRLFHPNTESAFHFVVEYMESNTLESSWVFLSDRETEGTFLWGDGAELEVNDEEWLNGHPNATNTEDKDCVILAQAATYKLKVEDCTKKKHYFCMIVTVVDGGWSDWGSWSGCSVTCGVGMETRDRTCTNPAPGNGGTVCDGADQETQECDTGVSCPVDGGWSDWGAWSGCSVTCGVGTETRDRTCTNPAPENSGTDCDGPHQETRQCDTGVSCPVDGGWSDWGPWSGCSVTCGVGTETRDRTCTNPAPENGGADCDGPDQETQECDTGVSCPVDGGWSDWGAWSGCSVTCGVGTETRDRTCTNPAPENGGTDCDGPARETRQCDTNVSCPALPAADCSDLYPDLRPAAAFDRYQNQCFWTSTSRVTYGAALQECESHGGTLAMIKDASTQTFLLQHLPTVTGRKAQRYWMGLDDLNTERSFVWNDGTPLGSYHKFRPRANRSHRGRDCVALWRTNKLSRWFILKCWSRLPYICQLDYDVNK
ncbi:uncharacterized protein LOC144916075 [Branchiostoma floridae x Branchiostoma belcheri]